MKLAFVTMVWRDYWLLDKWVRHNEKVVPRSQLYVIDHGGDPEIARIAEGCNIIPVPREEITPDLTRRRWDLLGGLTNGLLGFYDRVICTDVDEFIVYVGHKGGLVAHLAASEAEEPALSPVGLNLIPRPEDAQDDSLPVLERHPHALVSAKYTKPCIARSRVVYTTGGHGLQRGGFRIDPDILLFHLHYVTPDYAERMAARQEIVAQSRSADEGSGMPRRYWINWSDPAMIRDKEMGLYDRARDLDVSDGFEEAAQLLAAAVTRKGKQVVVDPKLMRETQARVTLPAALRGAI